jgi:uncharacterized protein YqgQ
MAGVGVSMFGSDGCPLEVATAMLGRGCSGPIQTGPFINGDGRDYKILVKDFEKETGTLTRLLAENRIFAKEEFLEMARIVNREMKKEKKGK